MAPPLGKPPDFSTEAHSFSTAVGQFDDAPPTGPAGHLTAALPAQSNCRQELDRPVGVRTHSVRGVEVLEIAGRLHAVVEDLDRAIQLALAEGPRGVICDLSAVIGGVETSAVEVLAAAGRHVRDWPAIPIAVASPDPQVHQGLAAHPLGGHLIVTRTLSSALAAVLSTPTVAIKWLHLSPHPTAPISAQDFVTRTLLDWRLDPVIPSASLAVSELVTNSMHTGTDINVSVAWNLGALRLSVRDDGPDQQRPHYAHNDPRGRTLSVVAVLSRAFGVLPTSDGGKVVWAVLNAARPRSATSPGGPEPATSNQESPVASGAPSPIPSHRRA